MTDQHPITPPPELLHQWATEYWGNPGNSIGESEKYIAIQAARWGADQELEACVELWANNSIKWTSSQLRDDRRPKPPSLKEQALAILSQGNRIPTAEDWDTIRRALEALPE
jgi:hypothetical protein